ncbi:methionyl-tRNA formyltransferase [soil metagenome]
MRDLCILFMGTPEFAVTILNKILESGSNVVGVVTAPDRPAGRGRKLQQSAVKEFAISRNLKVLQPTNLKSIEFINDLETLNPNVQVVVAFRMLPEIVWKFPEFGTFNLHASYLPHYRGAAPINWAIMNGEKTTGVSTFFIDDKIDTGEMILRKEIGIEDDENVGSLHDKLMNEGAQLVIDTLELIQTRKVSTSKQETGENFRDAPKLTRENTRISWNKPVEEIYNLIRGLDPYPAAWCNLKNGEEHLTVQIFDVAHSNESHEFPPGKVLAENKKLRVAARDGFIEIKEIKLQGKRKMKIIDLLNGYKFENDAKLL